MSNEIPNIHEFDFQLICEYFSAIERQGPGSPEATLKALSFIDNLTDESRIADIGCGSGGQTMVLAQHAPGQITGIDMFDDFISIFNANAHKLNLHHRVKGVVGNMEHLPFQAGELDLIWSEGAIYNIGFERGLKEWHKYLKTGGYLAVTEATWFTDTRPAEIHDFWMSEYPGINTIPICVAQLQAAGYIPVAVFNLPQSCWTDHYYAPQTAIQQPFLEKHAGNKMAQGLVDNLRHEKQLYDKYKEFYGYTFFIGKKV